MLTRFKNIILFTLLVTSYGLFTYNFFNGWWYSSIGSLLIIIICYLVWGGEFLKYTGLKLNLKSIFKSVILAGVITITAFSIIKYIASKNHVIIEMTNWKSYYHDIFYILNEEIVIGALLLLPPVLKRKISPLIASLGLAMFFALIHFIFYKWVMRDRGILELTTLITLFCVGFIRNNFIIQTGHIGYSWALHFGWIVVMFGSLHVDMDTGIRVPEPVRFNMYLGSIEMMAITLVLAGVSFVFCKKLHRSQQNV